MTSFPSNARTTRRTPVMVNGWVKTVRSSGGVSFVQINDGSSLADLQIVVDANCPDYALVDQLTTGCSVTAFGALQESPGRGQKFEVAASSLALLGGADPEEYPLQKKRHTLEFLRELAHLRPRTNTFGAVARVRNSMAFGIHKFFQERGFLYIQTPDHHGQRRRGRRGDVPRDHAGSRRSAEAGRQGR